MKKASLPHAPLSFFLVAVVIGSAAGCDDLLAALTGGGECRSDDDCRGTKICVDAACVECENDRDCDAGESCQDGECNRDDGAEGEGEGEGEEGEGEGEGEGVGGEGEGGEGEGEGGEGEGEAAVIEAACQNIASCSGGAVQDCVNTATQNLENAAGVGQFLCDEMHDAFLALLECDRTASCADIEAGTDCPTEVAAANVVSDQGALPCLSGGAPVAVPAGWDCPGRFFGVNDGCDCGCGVADSDCNGGGCTTLGCGGGSCEFCYATAEDAQAGAATTCPGEGEGEGEGE